MHSVAKPSEPSCETFRW